jgi:stage III sporulation protein SpoIIIAA
VTFVASCHGKCVEDVFDKKAFRKLFEDKVFLTACVLSSKNGKFEAEVKDVFKDGEIKC